MADHKCHAKNFRWYSPVIWKPLKRGTKMGGGKENISGSNVIARLAN